MTIIEINHTSPGLAACVEIVGPDPLNIKQRWKHRLFQQVNDEEMDDVLVEIDSFLKKEQPEWSDLYQIKHLGYDN